MAAAGELNRPYPVPPIFLVAAAVATMSLALEDWVAAGQDQVTLVVSRVQPSQEAEVVAPEVRMMEGQAAPASSSFATRRKPPSRHRARRVST